MGYLLNGTTFAFKNGLILPSIKKAGNLRSLRVRPVAYPLQSRRLFCWEFRSCKVALDWEFGACARAKFRVVGAVEREEEGAHQFP